MKRLLIISETWYPDSRATISIMNRIAMGIAKTGVEVYALPLKTLSEGNAYPRKHADIEILDVGDYSISANNCVRLGIMKLFQKAVRKILFAEKHLYFKRDGIVARNWNGLIDRLRQYQRSHWYNKVSEKIRELTCALAARDIIEEKQIDSILSVSLPFWIHGVGERTLHLCGAREITWIPISFDPYAYNEANSLEDKRSKIKEEHRVYKYAKRILMLSQSLEDYRDDALLSKICFFEIPNLEQPQSNKEYKFPFEESHCINCVFLGNLYWRVRNPEKLLRMFEQFSNERIHLHIIGGLDFEFPKNYFSDWEKRLGNRLTYHSRVSTETAAAIMEAADVLVNIGNTTANQCPSKVMEYISTGKPILSISKIEACTSAAYLRRYPLACLIREQDCEKQETIDAVESFVLKHNTERIDFADVASIFGDCTNEKAVDVILQAFT